MKQNQSKDLTGQIFGQWTVQTLHQRRALNGGVFFTCRCSCGTVEAVASTSLISGKSTKCRNCRVNATKKGLCLNGHVIEEWGRTSSYACRGCTKAKRVLVEYGITLEEYQRLWEAQEGKCAICGRKLRPIKSNGASGWGKEKEDGRIEIDHDHRIKGKGHKEAVRGLLCGGRWNGCNRKLGRIDDFNWLAAALNYIQNPPARKVLATT